MYKLSFIAILLVCVRINAFSQNFKPVANPEKIIAELKKSSQSTVSIQTDFTEEKHLAALKDPKTSSGKFYYKKDDKMRWEQQSPFKYIILINGDKLRVQDAGKEKNVGSAGRMAGQIKELMIGLVNGNFHESKAFKQSFAESADLYEITLTPVNKRLKNIYSKITLLFPKNSLRLKELVFIENGGDKSIMKFQNERINQPVSDNLFLNF